MSATTSPGRAYDQAKAELARIARRDGHESDAFIAANEAVVEAAKHISHWRAW